MSRSFVIGNYYPSGSVVHRLDARIKIILASAFATAVLLINNFAGLLAIFLIVATLFVAGRVPSWSVVKDMRPLLFIVTIAFVFQIFGGGSPWIMIGSVRISEAGLCSGAFVVVRLLLLVAGAAILTLTTTPLELSHAIEQLLRPFKKIGIPAQEIGIMIMIALRFIPALSDETDKIIKAQTARGVRFNTGSLLSRVRSAIPILIPLFVSVFRRSDELAEAMDARGFCGGSERTRMQEPTLHLFDIVVLVSGVVVIACTVWLGRLPVWQVS